MASGEREFTISGKSLVKIKTWFQFSVTTWHSEETQDLFQWGLPGPHPSAVCQESSPELQTFVMCNYFVIICNKIK